MPFRFVAFVDLNGAAIFEGEDKVLASRPVIKLDGLKILMGGTRGTPLRTWER